MPGFVRAVAIAERSLLGPRPTADHPGVAVVDEARREGLRVILVSERTFGELRGGGDTFLPHFDGVVAESGAALRVGSGPVRRAPASPPDALAEVLAGLDVDPHDVLGLSGEGEEADLLGELEVAVTAAPGSGEAALRQVLDDARAGRPATSPPRHDVTVRYPRGWGRSGRAQLPGAHANLLICVARGVARVAPRRDVPAQLLEQWSAAGYSVVVLDVDGRRGNGRVVTAGSSGWVDQFKAAMRDRHAPAVVDFSAFQGIDRSSALVDALTAVRVRRARSGRPHWLVIDPAARVMTDPDLPPEALDLGASGHCLVLRDHAAVPPALVASADAVLPCGPSCPLSA